MLMPLTVILVSLIALLRGGSLRNFGDLQLRWTPLAIGGFVLQVLIFTPFRDTPLIATWTTQIYELSMALLTIWVALNWRIPGMALMAAGLLMNFAAIVANGGYMPVSPESAAYAGRLERYAGEGQPVANNSLATGEGVRLWLFTDILGLPRQVPFANVFSVGDILLTIGTSVLCYRTIRGAPAPVAGPAPAPPSVEPPQETAVALARRARREAHELQQQIDQQIDLTNALSAQIQTLEERRDHAPERPPE